MPHVDQSSPRRTHRKVIAVGCVLWIAALALLTPWATVLRGPAARLASKAGVRLAFDAVGFGWGSVTLRDVRFGLEGTTGIEGTARSARVTWKPVRIDAEDVHLEFSACPLDSVLALARWARTYARVSEVPVSATNLDVSGLEVPPGDLVGTATGGAFFARKMPGRDPFVASWMRGSDGIDVVVGSRDAPRFRAEVAFSSGRTTLTIAPTSLYDLAAAACVGPESQTVVLSGRAILEPSANDLAPLVGHAEGRLEGFSLRPPYELQGMSFGSVATFRTDVELTRTPGRQLTFKHSRLVFGDIRFDGGGSTDPDGSFGLHGEIPCAAIADAARSTAAGPVLTAILNRPGADRRTDGWLTVGVGFGGREPWRQWGGQVGSDCGIVPIARLDPEMQKTLLARLDGTSVKSGMCWVLAQGRDYPGFTLSDYACTRPAVARHAAEARATTTVELTPKQRLGNVGDIVSFDAVVRTTSKTDVGVSCWGPARLVPADVPLRADEPRRIEAVVEPWRPAPDGGLFFGDGGPYFGSIQQALPIVPLAYAQIAPVWVEQDREAATGAPELTSSPEADEIVVRYRPRDAVDLGITMRAMLVKSNGTPLLYASARLRPLLERGPHRQPGTPVFRLAFPAEVARPVRVLMVEHHDGACAFRTLELFVR